MLWRLHEYENNPLKPQTFVLATDDKETIAIAKKLNIPLQDIKQLYAQAAEKVKAQDTRNKIGQAEIEFGIKVQSKAGSPIDSKLVPVKELVSIKGELVPDTEDATVLVSSVNQVQPSDTINMTSPDAAKTLESLPMAIESPADCTKQALSPEPTSTPPQSAPLANSEGNDLEVSASAINNLTTITNSALALDPLPPSEKANTAKPPSPQLSPAKKAAQVAKATEPASEDEDSDVDIVVFKPKSRPGSSYLKKTPEMTKASPPKNYTQEITQAVAQAEQLIQANSIKYETLPSNLDSSKQPIAVQEPIPEEPTPVVQPQKPHVPHSYTAALEMGLPKKAPVKPRPMTPMNGIQETKSTPVELPMPQSSRLTVNSPRSRPQTPRGGHIHGQNGFHSQPRHRPQTPRDTANQFTQHPDHRRSKKQSPPRSHQPKAIHSRSPSGEPSQALQAPITAEAIAPPEPSTTVHRQPSSRSSSSDGSSDKAPHRSASEGPSNPQKPSHNRPKRHPSYPRFNQVSAKAQRAAQYQPTTAPIVIDADSFDRSTYVKPQFHGIQAHNLNAHTMNGQPQYAGMNGNGRAVGGRGATMGGRAGPRNVDGDVDFVLKSGTPRGRGRGTGRLWVP